MLLLLSDLITAGIIHEEAVPEVVPLAITCAKLAAHLNMSHFAEASRITRPVFKTNSAQPTATRNPGAI